MLKKSPLIIKSLCLLAVVTMLTLDANAFQKEGPGQIKIGLLISDSKSVSAGNGAALAVKTANEKSGRNGNQFSLVVKTMEGQWGNGSKQAISLIFEDKVAALMGSCDGRNAHLAEQAATRSHVVFISAFSGDPTLSKAFVPWFFSCVYDYDQQAELLVDHFKKMKFKRILAIADDSYDSGLSLERFEKRSTASGQELQKAVSGPGNNIAEIISDIKSKDFDALVLFLNGDEAAKIYTELMKSKISIQVYCTTDLSQRVNEFENIYYISQGSSDGNSGKNFKQEYYKIYGSFPDKSAALAYDGINLLTEAINNGGTKSENIQKALAKIHLDGATGNISFDDRGRRSGLPELIQIKKGYPVMP